MKIEEESKESRMIKQSFIAKYIRADTFDNSNKLKGLSCDICDEKVLDLDKYMPQSKDEYIDILFNHLILKHPYEIHYGKRDE